MKQEIIVILMMFILFLIILIKTHRLLPAVVLWKIGIPQIILVPLAILVGLVLGCIASKMISNRHQDTINT